MQRARSPCCGRSHVAPAAPTQRPRLGSAASSDGEEVQPRPRRMESGAVGKLDVVTLCICVALLNEGPSSCFPPRPATPFIATRYVNANGVVESEWLVASGFSSGLLLWVWGF